MAYFSEFTYLAASILFIFGLKALSHPDTARRGMNLAALGMLMAIVGTLVRHEIVRYDWIIAGLIIGSMIGAAMSIWMPMTAMPERTALSHAFGALAASLVGISEYYRHGAELGSFKMTAIGFESDVWRHHGHWEYDGVRQTARISARGAYHVQRAKRL